MNGLFESIVAIVFVCVLHHLLQAPPETRQQALDLFQTGITGVLAWLCLKNAFLNTVRRLIEIWRN